MDEVINRFRHQLRPAYVLLNDRASGRGVVHPARVSNLVLENLDYVKALGADPLLAAWLGVVHDLWEDDLATMQEVLGTLPDRILMDTRASAAILLVSRSGDETYAEFITRIINSNVIEAKVVKNYDIQDNMTDRPEEGSKPELLKRYTKAKKRIDQELERIYLDAML